jgi:hypothetical protein
MALRFQCRNCGVDILVKFLQPGEIAECKNCGHLNEVPSDAAASELEPDYTRKVPFTRWKTLDLPSLDGVAIAGAGFWIRALARIIDAIVHNVVALIWSCHHSLSVRGSCCGGDVGFDCA